MGTQITHQLISKLTTLRSYGTVTSLKDAKSLIHNVAVVFHVEI